MNGEYVALATHIRTELADLERVLQRLDAMQVKFQQTQDAMLWDGIAFNLQSFYTSIEHILEDIVRTMDQALPQGAHWHQTLLQQMTYELPTIRPPVFTRATMQLLDEYRRFRHVMRNLYAFDLDPEQLERLLARLPACHQALTTDLTRFADFLDSIAH